MADAAIYDSEIEDLRSVYANDDSDPDDASIDIGDATRQRESRRRSCSIDKRGEEEDDMRALSTDARSSSVGSTSRPAPSAWEEESVPILDAGPLKPPPDYAAATAHRDEERLARAQRTELAEEQEWPLDTRAEAFDSEHPLVRNGIFVHAVTVDEPPVTEELSRPEPRSDNIQQRACQVSSDEEKAESLKIISHWSRKKRAWKRRCRKAVLRNCLIVVLVFGIFYFAMTNASLKRMSLLRSSPSYPGPTLEKARLPHPFVTSCLWTNYKSKSTDLSYTYPILDGYQIPPPHNFSFLESFSRKSHDTRVSGRIVLMGPTERLHNDARVTVEIASTPDIWVNDIKHRFDDRNGDYELLYPDIDGGGPSGCLDFAITIEHQQLSHLGNFTVNTTYFDIDIHGESLFSRRVDPWTGDLDGGLWIQDGTFSTVHGAISGSGWESNRTVVMGGAGGVSGTWPLRSTLAFETGSGDIRVSVAPQTGIEPHRHTAPLNWGENTYIAELDAASVNGSITIDFARDDEVSGPHERDYQAHISSVNGNIYGDYLFGSNTSLTTKTGVMNVRIIPITTGSPNATLYTENGSGLSNVWILKPLTAGNDFPTPNYTYHEKLHEPAENGMMASLQARHRSGSGAIYYVLPTVWSGIAILESESLIHVSDDVYEVLRNETRNSASMTVARGHGWSTLEIQSQNGEIMLDAFDG